MSHVRKVEGIQSLLRISVKHSAYFVAQILICSLLSIFYCQSVFSKPSPSSSPTTILLRDWVSDRDVDNLCHGHYRPWSSPHFLQQSKKEAKKQGIKKEIEKNDYYLQADQTTYQLTGHLILKGNVLIRQNDYELTCDQARAATDKQTNIMKTVDLNGRVHLFDRYKSFVAKSGHLDFVKKTATLYHVAYRIITNAIETHTQHIRQVWGTAKEVKKKPRGIVVLKEATYTTCSPISCAWRIRASQIRLNSTTGRGEALNAQLRIQDIPILYSPYFNFPLDKRRQTGFLFPAFHYSAKTGFALAVPYYLNLAPQYDATITPFLMPKRGVLVNGLFRYLTPIHQGTLDLSMMPFDPEFRRFQREAVIDYSTSPFLNRLKRASDTRYAMTWYDDAQWNQHWSSLVHYNIVSDDYYLRDFSHNAINNGHHQLLRQLQFNYANTHWQFLANLQDDHTLHLVDETPLDVQYARLPQLQLNGHWMEQSLHYHLYSEFVRFLKSKESTSLTNPTNGNRLSMRPVISLPIQWPFAYITPRAQLQLTHYHVQSGLATIPHETSLAIPLFDIKGGLYFDRNVFWGTQHYQQTLEPIVHYLYVPYRDQHDLPLFDTIQYPFQHHFLFQDNRFSGIDRISDAHQITFGLTTHLIDPDTGEYKATASIGKRYDFIRPRVSLCGDETCIAHKNQAFMMSPLAAMMTYYINQAWRVNGEIAWYAQQHHFENESLNLQYSPRPNTIFNAQYTVLRNPNFQEGETVETSRILQQFDLSGAWKLNNRWSIVGRWNYNWHEGQGQTALLGAAYESCCWAVRVVGGRTYEGLNINHRGRFESTIDIEFVLKGLGRVGNSNLTRFLTQSIEGYVDRFGQR